MIPWKDPLVHIPPDNSKVFAIDWHWKQEVPGSYRIIGGTVIWHTDNNGDFHILLQQNDEFGTGGQEWEFPHKRSEFHNNHNCNCLGAWCYDNELNLPEWLLEPESLLEKF